MARAVMRLYKGVSLAFGPTIANGFYYDFELDKKLNEDDFAAIEAEMAKIVEQAEPFEQFSLGRDEAVKLCGDLQQSLKSNTFKPAWPITRNLASIAKASSSTCAVDRTFPTLARSRPLNCSA